MTTTPATAKKRLTNLTLIVLSVVILLGVGLIVYFLGADKHVIKISIAPDESREVLFDELCLRPGESGDYTLRLSSEYAKKYQLTLRFDDQNSSLTLKDYAYVRMEQDGKTLCDRRLSELFEQEAMKLAIDFTDGENNDIYVSFYMPAEVGNEAQGAEADFKLLVTATSDPDHEIIK